MTQRPLKKDWRSEFDEKFFSEPVSGEVQCAAHKSGATKSEIQHFIEKLLVEVAEENKKEGRRLAVNKIAEEVGDWTLEQFPRGLLTRILESARSTEEKKI